MSTTTKDLGNGQWLVNDGVGNSWTATQDELSASTRAKETEIERAHQRVSDWKATEDTLKIHVAEIEAGTLLPEPGTDLYLIEYPTNNYYTTIRDDLDQAIVIQQNHQAYMNNKGIPNMETDLAVMNDALDQIATEPIGGETEILVATGLPVNIPSDPDDDLVIILTSIVATEVTYVKLRVVVDHPAAPAEQLKISLLKNGEHRQMFYGDMQMDDDQTFETAYFNGMFASGDWSVHLINDHTASVNVLKVCELTIYHS